MVTIIRWALTLALVAGVIFGIVRGYEWWRDGKVAEGDRAGAARVQQVFDAYKLKQAALQAEAVAKARKEEQDIAAAAAQGERNALDKAQRDAAASKAAAARSAAVAGGLSGNIAALDRAAAALGIPDAATCPARFAEQRAAAVRAREVLGSCVAAYRELGQAVDDSWGAITLKLDTALGYINAVAPPRP